MTPMNLKPLFNILLKALVLTMFCAAFFHMIVIFFVAITTGNFAYLNPLSFLGISIIAPETPSQTTTLFGWMALCLLFVAMVWLIMNITLILAWVYDTKAYKHSLLAVQKLKKAQQLAHEKSLKKQKNLPKKTVSPDKKEAR